MKYHIHLILTCCRWKFVCAYLYDQAGSMVYYYVLGKSELSTAVLIANGLTFAFAGLAEAIVEKRIPSRATLEGSLLILAGAYIAYSSKQ